MTRPKHPIKELETLLKEAESKSGDVEKTKAYYRLRCPAASIKPGYI